MEAETFILVPKRVLDDISQIKSSLEQIKLAVASDKKVGENLYYISQVARMLHKAPNTIKKMLKSGIIHGTVNGMIPESSIERYLKGE
jgi:hypothetical protein